MYGIAVNPGVAYSYRVLVSGDRWDEDPATAAYNTFQHVAGGQALVLSTTFGPTAMIRFGPTHGRVTVLVDRW